MATYVTNLVYLIGFGIAVDYSLLIVYRFREELEQRRVEERGDRADDGDGGRAVVFSGATVAIGLALLLFIPVPFMRSMGVGGFLIPLVSLAAAVTLQPALLSVYGRRGIARDLADVAKKLVPHFAGLSRARSLGASRARDHAPACSFSRAGPRSSSPRRFPCTRCS